MTWADRPYLCVDTETTGVDCYNDRVVEYGWAAIGTVGDVLEAKAIVVDPGVDIPEGASDVHGITTERARSEGGEPATALTELAQAVRFWTQRSGAPVVMFNARFDWPLIVTEAERHGVNFPAFVPIVDPYVLDRHVDKYRKGKRNLGVTAAHYGVELGEAAHGALADCIATGQILRAMLLEHPELAAMSLPALHLLQVRAQEEQRASFADYMRRTNDPSFDSPVGWPYPAAS